VHWIHEVWVDGAVTFRAGRQGTGLVAEWPGLATLACGKDGSGAEFVAALGAPKSLLGKLQRGQVRALLHDLRGGLGLHGSAVAVDGRAVLFIGASGVGKSTAAAEMCLLHGAQLLADDAALLEVGPSAVQVLPAEEEHWLTSESCRALGVVPRRAVAGRNKHARRATRIAHSPWPLAVVIALRFARSVAAGALCPLRGGDAARMLLGASIRFDPEDGAARRRELEQLTRVYDAAPILELVRCADAPEQVVKFVTEALGRGRR
jgi:hypothetical protein